MMLKFLIVDLDADALSVWSDILQEFTEIEFMNIDFTALVRNSEIDAILMRSIFAYERYGGMPSIGASKVISTNGEIGVPPWVVTTPMFRQDAQPQPQEYDYIEFCKIFESILLFNATCDKDKICMIGFELSFLYGFRNSSPYIKEAEGFKKAYLKCCG